MSELAPRPEIEVGDHQDTVAVDVAQIRALAEAALPFCLAKAERGDTPLAGLGEIDVAIVDDAAIAAVHAEFLDDPTPTDVITFDHGEIVVSAETAAARAAEFGNDPARELALYVVHGLMHLAGWRDQGEAEAAAMAAAQEEALAAAERAVAEAGRD